MSSSSLPAVFLEALRRLFDLLDKSNCGQIRLSDLEQHWRPQDNLGVPDVLFHLRKVCSNQGLLSWERFSAGVKMAVLRHEASRSRSIVVDQSNTNGQMNYEDHKSYFSVNPSRDNASLWSSPPLVRARSLPNLSINSSLSISPGSKSPKSPPLAPPKPPRELILAATRRHFEQFGNNEPDGHLSGPKKGVQGGRRSRLKQQIHLQHARRHSVHLGVDLSRMKHFQSLREAKWTLDEGLLTLELVRQCFRRRLLSIDDQLKGGVNQTPSRNSQEKLASELRITRQLTERLRNLTSSSNVAVSDNSKFMPEDLLTDHQLLERQVANLKAQNKLLTNEVGEKSVVIAKLQEEKAALIKEVFNATVAKSSLKYPL